MDEIKQPSHYTSSPAACVKCGHKIECRFITEHFLGNLANVIKYVWRAGFKGTAADAVKDLKKAREYTDFEIEKRLREKVPHTIERIEWHENKECGHCGDMVSPLETKEHFNKYGMCTKRIWHSR